MFVAYIIILKVVFFHDIIAKIGYGTYPSHFNIGFFYNGYILTST